MDSMQNTKCAVRKGFTLVELLVVIAIIALLMSILLPTLARAKKQAAGAACMVHLKQWALMFAMFTSDHDGYLPASVCSDDAYYLIAMLPYLGAEKNVGSKGRDVFLCPLARNSRNPDSCNRCPGTTYSAWGPFDPAATGSWWDTGAMGSYGLNDWCANPPEDCSFWGQPHKDAWRTPDVRSADNIPLFLDCLYTDGFPRHDDEPPAYPDQYDSWSYNAMKMFCIDRHGGYVHGVFLDFSVRKIGLKELWKLKWHRRYNLNWPAPDWRSLAPWMNKFKDY